MHKQVLSNSKDKRSKRQLEAVRLLIVDNEKLSYGGKDFFPQVERLLRAMKELEAVQAPFSVVDSELPFNFRTERLMKWLGTHPAFKEAGVAIVDDLPATRGFRGVRATKSIKAGAQVFAIPPDAFMSTETAAISRELGPLIAQASELGLSALGDMPTVALAVHLMVEHAKALEAPLAASAASGSGSGSATSADAAQGVPPMQQTAFPVKDLEAEAEAGAGMTPVQRLQAGLPLLPHRANIKQPLVPFSLQQRAREPDKYQAAAADRWSEHVSLLVASRRQQMQLEAGAGSSKSKEKGKDKDKAGGGGGKGNQGAKGKPTAAGTAPSTSSGVVSASASASEPECDNHGHSHAHGDHGHSHGSGDHSHSHGSGDQNHSHGSGDHGHSHGSGDHGHSHGSGDHGHSHGSGDHGHSHGSGDHGHSHGAHTGDDHAASDGGSGSGVAAYKLGGGGGGGLRDALLARVGRVVLDLSPASPKDAPPPRETILMRTTLHPVEGEVGDMELKAEGAWGSRFRAYLSLLPHPQFSCLYFDSAHLRQLEGAPKGVEMAHFIVNSVRTYLVLNKMFVDTAMISGFEHYFTWAHFKWALSCVMSRQNNCLSPHNPYAFSTLSLVPLYDMLNHAAGPITSHYELTGSVQQLTLAAQRDVEPGDEVTMSYGDRTSHETLQFQGMTALDPERDTAIFESAIPLNLENDQLVNIRKSLLLKLNLHPAHHCAWVRRTYEFQMLQTRVAELTRYVGSRPDDVKKLEEFKKEIEKMMWTARFQFPIGPDGGIEPDIRTFFRTAALTLKPVIVKLVGGDAGPVRVLIADAETRAVEAPTASSASSSAGSGTASAAPCESADSVTVTGGGRPDVAEAIRAAEARFTACRAAKASALARKESQSSRIMRMAELEAELRQMRIEDLAAAAESKDGPGHGPSNVREKMEELQRMHKALVAEFSAANQPDLAGEEAAAIQNLFLPRLSLANEAVALHYAREAYAACIAALADTPEMTDAAETARRAAALAGPAVPAPVPAPAVSANGSTLAKHAVAAGSGPVQSAIPTIPHQLQADMLMEAVTSYRRSQRTYLERGLATIDKELLELLAEAKAQQQQAEAAEGEQLTASSSVKSDEPSQSVAGAGSIAQKSSIDSSSHPV